MAKTPPSESFATNDKTDSDGVIKFKVHYQGWNTRYDEWVEADRLYHWTEENLAKKKELDAAVASGGKSKRAPSQGGIAEEKSSKKSIATGGKHKAGSSGPSTPFDGQTVKMSAGDSGSGLEMESRASTPSGDGRASVASTSTTGQASVPQSASAKKRKAPGTKSKTGSSSKPSTPANEAPQTPSNEAQTTPVTAETKRKRARQSIAAPVPAPVQMSALVPAANTNVVDVPTGVETFDQFKSRQEVLVKMPEELKEVVIDDWELINRQYKLVKLPAAKTIEDILFEYGKTKVNNKGIKSSQISETIAGIREYFNEMCGVHLLYKFERPQFNEILAKQNENELPAEKETSGSAQNNAGLSSNYGLPHLLRLFTRIGHMLAYTDLDQKSMDAIVTWLHDFLRFLAKNKTMFYDPNTDYFTPPPEYQREAYSH